MECLTGENLGYQYQQQPVLMEASLTLRPRQVTVLMGPSGAGKSTLIWILAGLVAPHAGRVLVGPDGGTPAGPADYRRMRIGMVFQQPALWDHLTAEQHLSLVLAGKGLDRAQRRRQVEDMLARVRLDRLRRRRPGQLSGGEQRRLAIARAMVVEPQWLFLDEPLAHLDGPMRLDLFSLLRDVLADSQPGVLLATHNPSEALRVADRVVVMLDGRIAQQGPAEEVYHRPVSLAAAQILGPAGEVAGEAIEGVLRRDGVPLLANLPPSLRGPTRLIVRPEQLHFCPQPTGEAKVVRCEFTAGRYSLAVQVGHNCLTACSDRPVAPGTSGQLHLRSPVTEAIAGA